MAFSQTGLKTHIWNNNLKSFMILGFYPILILLCFWMFAFVIGVFFSTENQTEATDISVALDITNSIFANYWLWIILVCVAWFGVSYFFHGRMVRKLAVSHPVTRKDEPELYNMLENMSIEAGVTMPKIEIIETHARNAFASGINPQTFTVTVTRGLMNSLTKEELKAVLAHELTHILNRDVRLMIITIIFTGLFAFAAQLTWRAIRYRVFFNSNKRSKTDPRVIFIILIAAAILSLGYLATLVMRFAISRKREYMADAGAIELTKNPEAMMNALRRINNRADIPESTQDIAMMCIENAKPLLGFFRTHPPIEQRIEAIARTNNISMPTELSLPPINQGKIESKQTNPWLIRNRRP
jgi:heat shock protein HtpX